MLLYSRNMEFLLAIDRYERENSFEKAFEQTWVLSFCVCKRPLTILLVFE